MILMKFWNFVLVQILELNLCRSKCQSNLIYYIKCGNITSFYLIWYGIGRLIIESFRTDSLMLGNLKVARIVSVIMFILGVMIELVQSRKPKLDDLYNSVETEEIRC